MTPEDLLDLFRTDLDDTDTADPLWSDLEIYSYMDEAQKLFARRTDYFADSTTAEIVTVAVTADDPLIVLDPRIIKIRGALSSAGRKLTAKKYADIDSSGYGRDPYDSFAFATTLNWETSTGEPQFIITDYEPGFGRLVPIPTASDTLSLRVFRLPLDDLNEDNNSDFEITETEYQRGLIYYMKYLAYQKADSDLYNEDKYREALGLFDSFISRVNRDLKRLRFGSTMGTVRYGGL